MPQKPALSIMLMLVLVGVSPSIATADGNKPLNPVEIQQDLIKKGTWSIDAKVSTGQSITLTLTVTDSGSGGMNAVVHNYANARATVSAAGEITITFYNTDNNCCTGGRLSTLTLTESSKGYEGDGSGDSRRCNTHQFYDVEMRR